MSRVAVVSFRLGGTDGVAVEAAKWCEAWRTLGHDVITVAGEGPVDRPVPGLAIRSHAPPRVDELVDVLDDADLVVVENLVSLPLNPRARLVLLAALEGRRALFHHHDLPWQRANLAHLEGPRDAPTWRHVTINELSRRELGARGISATTIYNSFDCDPPSGDRDATREELGAHGLLALLPSRALARKNIASALALCESLGATLWLLGPSEDDYEHDLLRLLARTRAPVHRGLAAHRTIHDAYAACDLVVMSSTWEGFGNPVLESVTHRRPLALWPYPVAAEIVAHGFTFFSLDDAAPLSKYLSQPDPGLLSHNLAIARREFNVRDLPARLAAVTSNWGLD